MRPQLHNDEERLHVFWSDPDEGCCSQWYCVEHMIVQGTTVILYDVHGNHLLCPVEELTDWRVI